MNKSELRKATQSLKAGQALVDGHILKAIDADAYLLRLERCGVADDVRDAATKHGATLSEVFSDSRLAHIVRARAAAMLVLRDRLKWSYTAIGNFFGRDHATVMYHVKNARQQVQK